MSSFLTLAKMQADCVCCTKSHVGRLARLGTGIWMGCLFFRTYTHASMMNDLNYYVPYFSSFSSFSSLNLVLMLNPFQLIPNFSESFASPFPSSTSLSSSSSSPWKNLKMAAATISPSCSR